MKSAFSKSLLTAMLLAPTVTACAGAVRPRNSQAYVAARIIEEPPPPKPIIVTAPQPPPGMPGQMKPMPKPPSPTAAKKANVPPQEVVSEANKRAAQAPDANGTLNAIVQYSYEPGTLYQVFAAPMRITDLALQPGERIVGQPACGDTVRWVIAQGKSIEGGVEQAHIYLKPTRPGLETNLAINTDHHAYMFELHSYEETYMAVVAFRFPHDEVAKIEGDAAIQAAQQKDSAPVVGLSSLNFKYTIQVVKGKPAWTPVQVFDDGRRTFVRFPETMLVREAPALFVLRDKETQLVNYRMKNDFYVIDRLIDTAELRILGKDTEEIVHIARTSKS